MTTPQPIESTEFVTIIGSDMAEIAREFQAQGLSDKDYAIVSRAGRHRFTHVDGERTQALFDGRPLIAATYRRRSH